MQTLQASRHRGRTLTSSTTTSGPATPAMVRYSALKSDSGCAAVRARWETRLQQLQCTDKSDFTVRVHIRTDLHRKAPFSLLMAAAHTCSLLPACSMAHALTGPATVRKRCFMRASMQPTCRCGQDQHSHSLHSCAKAAPYILLLTTRHVHYAAQGFIARGNRLAAGPCRHRHTTRGSRDHRVTTIRSHPNAARRCSLC